MHGNECRTKDRQNIKLGLKNNLDLGTLLFYKISHPSQDLKTTTAHYQDGSQKHHKVMAHPPSSVKQKCLKEGTKRFRGEGLLAGYAV